jgi:hypothetical protein
MFNNASNEHCQISIRDLIESAEDQTVIAGAGKPITSA